MTKAGATVGSGAIVVCDDRACMLDMALNSVRFFRNESCGKCVPGRTDRRSSSTCSPAGRWERAAPTTCDLHRPHACVTDDVDLRLGQVVPVPIASVLKHFRTKSRRTCAIRCAAGVCFEWA